MNYLDCVEVTVENEAYARHGVHKGMQGVIWMENCIDGAWDVLFPQYGEKEDVAEIPVQEEHLCLLPHGMNAQVNERIKAAWGD